MSPTTMLKAFTFGEVSIAPNVIKASYIHNMYNSMLRITYVSRVVLRDVEKTEEQKNVEDCLQRASTVVSVIEDQVFSC